MKLLLPIFAALSLAACAGDPEPVPQPEPTEAPTQVVDDDCSNLQEGYECP